MPKKRNEEKNYPCPNCGEDKEEIREECPQCHYADKKLGVVVEKSSEEH